MRFSLNITFPDNMGAEVEILQNLILEILRLLIILLALKIILELHQTATIGCRKHQSIYLKFYFFQQYSIYNITQFKNQSRSLCRNFRPQNRGGQFELAACCGGMSLENGSLIPPSRNTLVEDTWSDHRNSDLSNLSRSVCADFE